MNRGLIRRWFKLPTSMSYQHQQATGLYQTPLSSPLSTFLQHQNPGRCSRPLNKLFSARGRSLAQCPANGELQIPPSSKPTTTPDNLAIYTARHVCSGAEQSCAWHSVSIKFLLNSHYFQGMKANTICLWMRQVSVAQLLASVRLSCLPTASACTTWLAKQPQPLFGQGQYSA